MKLPASDKQREQESEKVAASLARQITSSNRVFPKSKNRKFRKNPLTYCKVKTLHYLSKGTANGVFKASSHSRSH